MVCWSSGCFGGEGFFSWGKSRILGDGLCGLVPWFMLMFAGGFQIEEGKKGDCVRPVYYDKKK